MRSSSSLESHESGRRRPGGFPQDGNRLHFGRPDGCSILLNGGYPFFRLCNIRSTCGAAKRNNVISLPGDRLFMQISVTGSFCVTFLWLLHVVLFGRRASLGQVFAADFIAVASRLEMRLRKNGPYRHSDQRPVWEECQLSLCHWNLRNCQSLRNFQKLLMPAIL